MSPSGFCLTEVPETQRPVSYSWFDMKQSSSVFLTRFTSDPLWGFSRCVSFVPPPPPDDGADPAFGQSLDHVPGLETGHVLQADSLDLQEFVSTLETAQLCRSA